MKNASILFITVLTLAGCGLVQPTSIESTPTETQQVETPRLEPSTEAEPTSDLITRINEELPLYEKASMEFEGMSTEGAIATYYTQRDELKKIHVVYFGETGKRVNQFYFEDGELSAATTTLYNYNSHIMDPDFDENDATVESQTIIYPEKEISKTGDDLQMEAHQFEHYLDDPVDPSGQWTYYEKDFFSLSYPPGFTVVNEQSDYGTFVSPDGTVTISIYSPLWTGSPDLLLPQPGETVSATKEETTPSSGNELGQGTTRAIQWITVAADDGSYTRSIVDTRFIGPDGSETRLTWSIQYQDQEAYDRYKKDYLKMKESLIQYAD